MLSDFPSKSGEVLPVGSDPTGAESTVYTRLLESDFSWVSCEQP